MWPKEDHHKKEIPFPTQSLRIKNLYQKILNRINHKIKD